MMKRLLTAILFVLTLPVCAQVSFQFVPEIYGRTVDGLFNCRILNMAGGAQAVTLSITVTERANGRVLQVKTASFSLMPGSNAIPVSAVRNAGISFASNQFGQLIRQNGYLPAGSYDYCYTLTPSTGSAGGPSSDQCFNYDLSPFAPLNLTEPYDKDKICEKRPLLSWQPSVPTLPGTSYQLVLAEVKDNQNATEALRYNLPVISQQGISSPLLPFPAIAKELEQGKTYAWQVSAYKGQAILNRSEVWQFTVNCSDNVIAAVTDEGYRDIEDLLKGNYYVAEGSVRFAVQNPYNEQPLSYTISSITDGRLQIKRLPKTTLKKGRNKVIIDLSRNRAFKDGHSYIMNVNLPNGSVKSLRFLYKDVDEGL